MLDVVKPPGPPTDLWQSRLVENGRGGIYFYQEDRLRRRGARQPDFGRPEVRACLMQRSPVLDDAVSRGCAGTRPSTYPYHGGGCGLADPNGWRFMPSNTELAIASGPCIAEDMPATGRTGGHRKGPASAPRGRRVRPCGARGARPAPTRSPRRCRRRAIAVEPADAFSVNYPNPRRERHGATRPREVWQGLRPRGSRKRATRQRPRPDSAGERALQGQELVEGNGFTTAGGVVGAAPHHAGCPAPRPNYSLRAP